MLFEVGYLTNNLASPCCFGCSKKLHKIRYVSFDFKGTIFRVIRLCEYKKVNNALTHD